MKTKINIKSLWIEPGWPLIRHAALFVLLLGIFGYSVHSEGFSWGYLVGTVLLLAAIELVLNFKYEAKFIIGVVIYVLAPAISFYLMEGLWHEPWTINPGIQILNLVFYYLLALLFYFITGRARIGAIAGTVVPMVIGIANYYVICFRSSPILPWDLLSVNTALSVTSNYEFTIPARVFLIVLGFILLLALENKIQLRIKKLRIRIGALAGCALSLFLYGAAVQTDEAADFFGFDETLFTPIHLYNTNGFAVGFLYDLQYMEVDKPEGYNLENIQSVVDEYGHDENQLAITTEEVKKPNIIVIMDEAFSDLSVLGDFETNVDYMPFIRSLSENTVKGNLFVSVKGGNTANTEFEFLTGNTMSFLPMGSVAYQQYIHQETPSLVSYLNEGGYNTVALHPYYASGWDRDEVYSYLGFDETYFYYDFTYKELIRKYVSDRSAFRQIIDVYENKEEGKPLFAFEVTMQNHGGYYQDYDNFTSDVELLNVADSKNKHYTELYLSLIKETDAAFEELVNYFSEQEEETIILLFGDHQPADLIAKPILNLNGKLENRTFEEEQAQYEVPFVIWANYDIEEAEIERISANYLSSLLLETAGVPLNGYQSYLWELYEEVPVITANTYIDKEGNYYTSMDNPYSEQIKEYAVLQYNYLFEKNDPATWELFSK